MYLFPYNKVMRLGIAIKSMLAIYVFITTSTTSSPTQGISREIDLASAPPKSFEPLDYEIFEEHAGLMSIRRE